MISNLFALFIWMQNPDEWKQQVYEKKYEEKINLYISNTKSINNKFYLRGNISWYASGKYKDGSEFKGEKLTTACAKEYRGRTFKVTYNRQSIIVVCNDTGVFASNGNGRVLDLSLFAFEILAPRSMGIIKGAKIEIIK
jgi:rare lipoprotein A (peptidoglycan hydrolase)